MRIAKTPLLVVGVLLLLAGVLWAAQGSGIFPYPAASFMINQTPWIYNGGLTALAGLAAIFASRRI